MAEFMLTIIIFLNLLTLYYHYECVSNESIEDTEIKSIINVLNSRVDKFYFTTNVIFILFGISLIFFVENNYV